MEIPSTPDPPNVDNTPKTPQTKKVPDFSRTSSAVRMGNEYGRIREYEKM